MVSEQTTFRMNGLTEGNENDDESLHSEGPHSESNMQYKFLAKQKTQTNQDYRDTLLDNNQY